MRDVVQWETPWVGLGACVWCWAKPGLASQKPASVGLSSLPGYKICSFSPRFAGDLHRFEHRGRAGNHRLPLSLLGLNPRVLLLPLEREAAGKDHFTG